MWFGGVSALYTAVFNGRETVVAAKKKDSPTGIRTRVAWVKTTYPDQLDYWGRLKTNLGTCVFVLYPSSCLLVQQKRQNASDWSGIRTHASEETSALNWRLRPLGHPTGAVV